ncbi:putative Xaa-Pro aminopeptidase [Sphaerosporella brunnea]|uniref:Xaa-Pro aminopeptidase n=1 Tax=Sphaerosporella brunnea TaxID=1250544 RepID=A0A5J5EMD7_9PEZI|nr:putative Xaa-Pro aminopeptidase [Sphaerosporella brunnea]
MATSIDEILSGKYPAKAHALRVSDCLRQQHPSLTNGYIYLESIKSSHYEDSDQEVSPLRQRRAFFYLSGCNLADSSLLYSIAEKKLTLYIPSIDPEDVLWSGLPMSVEQACEKFDVDEVRTADQIDSDLRSIEAAATPAQPIFILEGRVSRVFQQQVEGSLITGTLKTAIDECRALKDAYEVALIKRANAITAEAHHAVMARVRASSNERELNATFLERCVSLGAPTQAYTGIFAAGRAAATLHYVHNDATLKGKQLLLLDAGCEVDCYASDVTRTFPISGSFSKEAREIYDVVLTMQKECLALCKPGKNWDEVHVHAHRVAIKGLKALGVLKGDEEELLSSRVSCAFLPHGLGHYLGMDTHDTGGHPNYQDEDKMFRYLRKRGPLPVGAVITVEPGIYFCEFIIRPYLQDSKFSKFIDEATLEKYWDVGGVRIEDNILITPGGYENLTTAAKEVGDMLAIINA